MKKPKCSKPRRSTPKRPKLTLKKLNQDIRAIDDWAADLEDAIRVLDAKVTRLADLCESYRKTVYTVDCQAAELRGRVEALERKAPRAARPVNGAEWWWPNDRWKAFEQGCPHSSLRMVGDSGSGGVHATGGVVVGRAVVGRSRPRWTIRRARGAAA